MIIFQLKIKDEIREAIVKDGEVITADMIEIAFLANLASICINAFNFILEDIFGYLTDYERYFTNSKYHANYAIKLTYVAAFIF